MSRTALGLALLALAVATGCGPSGHADRTLTVFAAASLTKPFSEIGEDFEAAHDGVRVRFSFGGSADLVAQIRSGAPADVFASADTRTMGELGPSARQPQDFAANTLEIAVPPGNPAGIGSLAEVTRPGVRLVVCAPEVPCGTAARRVARAAHVTLDPVSEEQSVTDVLGKVATGEADAGLVYVTDVRGAANLVDGVPFPESADAVNTYPIATLAGSDHEDLAQQFVAFVLGPPGQRVLAAAGFAAP